MTTQNNPQLQKFAQKLSDIFKEKKTIIAFAIVMAIVIIGLLANGGRISTTDDSNGCQSGDLYDRVTGTPCVGTVNSEAVPEESYTTALKSYEGKSISFDANCTPTPKSLTVKTGSKVLFANNSTKVQELEFSGKSVILPAYRYTTSTLDTLGTVSVRCGDTPAAATVVVQ